MDNYTHTVFSALKHLTIIHWHRPPKVPSHFHLNTMSWCVGLNQQAIWPRVPNVSESSLWPNMLRHPGDDSALSQRPVDDASRRDADTRCSYYRDTTLFSLERRLQLCKAHMQYIPCLYAWTTNTDRSLTGALTFRHLFSCDLERNKQLCLSMQHNGNSWPSWDLYYII